jgi:molecular chaperone GrpE
MFNKTSSPETQQDAESHAVQEGEVSELSGEPTEDAPELTVQSVGEDWKGKYHQMQDQFTRLAADFENYRKRSRDEQESLIKYGAQKSIMELLPVLDNLERANASLNENSDPAALYKSFSLMQKQLLDGLEAMGVRKVSAIGQEFDPQFHEAVNRMPSKDFPENSNMYEAQSGYQLHDKVIRPAQVVVSTGSPDGEPADLPTADSLKAEADRKANPFSK